MNDPTPTDFEKYVMSIEPPAAEFRPIAAYDPDGDCVEFLATNANFYAKRVDSRVTVYYDQETDGVVGGLIKGISRMTSDPHVTPATNELHSKTKYHGTRFQLETWTIEAVENNDRQSWGVMLRRNDSEDEFYFETHDFDPDKTPDVDEVLAKVASWFNGLFVSWMVDACSGGESGWKKEGDES